LKTIEEFEGNVLELYDELQHVLETVQNKRTVSSAEVLCVLSSMLCTTARQSGITAEDFLWTLELNFLKNGDMSFVENETLH